jgi:hypothetical protein
MATTNLKRQITRVSNLLRLLLPNLKQGYEKIKLGTIEGNDLTDLKENIYKATAHVNSIRKYVNEWVDLIQADEDELQDYEKYMEDKSRPDDLAEDTSILLDQYNQAIEAHEKLVIKTSPQTQSPPPTETPAPVPQTIIQNVEELKLPNFYGDRANWKTFKDLCEAVIEQEHYPPIQRWIKLVNHVKGEAAQHIQGLQITNDSYSQAMKILESFYGNESEIELELLRQWNGLKPAQNIEQVRQLLIQVNRLNRQFASINVETNLTVFKHHLITRLPSWVVKKIWKQNSDKSMDELIKEAEELIKQEDFVGRIKQESAQTSISSPRKSNHSRQENTNQHWNSQADSARQTNSPKSPCVFCNGNHWNNECTVYTTPQQRSRRIGQLDLCMNCLKKGHTADSCRLQSNCPNCQRKHHKLLCFAKIQNENTGHGTGSNNIPISNTRSQMVTRKDGNQNLAVMAIQQESIVGVVSEHSIVMTKDIEIQSEDSQIIKTAKVVFDSGSALTLMRKKLADQLKLVVEPDEISIKTVGPEENVAKTIGTSQVIFKLKDRDMAVKVHVIEDICSPILMAHNIPDDLDKVKDWEVEKHLLPAKPDIFIGIRDYWDFEIVNTNQTLPNGLNIATSAAGLIVSGICKLQNASRIEANSSIPAGLAFTGIEESEKRNEIVMMSKTITINSPKENQKGHSAKVFFDSGCSANLISQELAKKLELNLEPIAFRIKTLDNGIIESIAETEFMMLTPNGKQIKTKAYVVESIGSEMNMAPDISNSMQNLKSETISVISARPEIVIGLESYCQAKVRGTETILPNGLRVIKSAFGLMVCGRLNQQTRSPATVINCAAENSFSKADSDKDKAKESFNKASSDKDKANKSQKGAVRVNANLIQINHQVASAVNTSASSIKRIRDQDSLNHFKASYFQIRPDFRSINEDQKARHIQLGKGSSKKRLRSPFTYGLKPQSTCQENHFDSQFGSESIPSDKQSSSVSAWKFNPIIHLGETVSRAAKI